MLTYATGASRLATPWKVALIRAQALANTALPNGLIVDPACGSGGFLVETLRYVWAKVEKKGEDLGWPRHEIEAEKQKLIDEMNNLKGVKTEKKSLKTNSPK